jgi:hypothetical protein
MREPKTKGQMIKRLYEAHKDRGDIVDHIYLQLLDTKFRTSKEYISNQIKKLQNGS